MEIQKPEEWVRRPDGADAAQSLCSADGVRAVTMSDVHTGIK